MVNKDNVLHSRTREEILRILYDGEERSAYRIAKELGIAVATAVDHLQKLVEEGMIVCRNADIGNINRRHYRITEEGKTALLEFTEENLRRLPSQIQEYIKEIISE